MKRLKDWAMRLLALLHGIIIGSLEVIVVEIVTDQAKNGGKATFWWPFLPRQPPLIDFSS